MDSAYASSADEKNGRIGVVIDNGCLFRGGKERAIREAVIEQKLVECIILLPEKLFYNGPASAAIIILNKNRKKEFQDKVLIINASPEFEQHPDVRKLNRLGTQNISKIANTYKVFDEIEGFSRAVPLEEIKKNDYNLNVTLYVFPEKETEKIDVDKEWKDLLKIQDELAAVEKKIEGYLEEIK